MLCIAVLSFRAQCHTQNIVAGWKRGRSDDQAALFANLLSLCRHGQLTFPKRPSPALEMERRCAGVYSLLFFLVITSFLSSSACSTLLLSICGVVNCVRVTTVARKGRDILRVCASPVGLIPPLSLKLSGVHLTSMLNTREPRTFRYGTMAVVHNRKLKLLLRRLHKGLTATNQTSLHVTPKTHTSPRPELAFISLFSFISPFLRFLDPPVFSFLHTREPPVMP